MKKPKQIAFTADKHGKPLAYQWGGSCQMARWFRIGYDEAKLLLATGQAIQVPYVK